MLSVNVLKCAYDECLRVTICVGGLEKLTKYNAMLRNYVLIASFFAFAISWYGVSKWLETFAYRTNFNLMIALGSGIGVLFISLVMVSYQPIKAAMGNPVESLRNE